MKIFHGEFDSLCVVVEAEKEEEGGGEANILVEYFEAYSSAVAIFF